MKIIISKYHLRCYVIKRESLFHSGIAASILFIEFDGETHEGSIFSELTLLYAVCAYDNYSRFILRIVFAVYVYKAMALRGRCVIFPIFFSLHKKALRIRTHGG